MKFKGRAVFGLAVLLVVLLLSSCPNPIGSSNSKGGSLSIQITDNINARTLLPPIDMIAASFTVSGTGPGGATFTQTTSGGPLTVEGLAFGIWNVTVNALDAGGVIIGSGQATVTVHTGQTATAAISVVPLSGNGTLSLTVTWTAAQVETPSIRATLTPPSGPAAPLSFSITDNQATWSSTTIPAGYQTLTLELLDNNIPVMGAVEVARIVAGQTTTGTYAFTNVNQPGGNVVVNITPAMADPIPVSIDGVPSTITAGTSITATASVTDGTSGAVYVWYLNGVSKATGSSYTFGSTLAAGYYRLDVTAYTADGTRAGSATASFQAYAAGEAHSYTITFDKNDTGADGSMAPQTVASGSSANLTANSFSKPGWVFAGWAATAEGAVAYADGASYAMGTGDVTLYAKWDANSYTITFDKNDAGAGGTMSPQAIASGASANLTANSFSKPGWVFAGWAATAGGAAAYADGASYPMGTGDVTLYAKWIQLAAVTTSTASSVTGASATLNGLGNPNGSETTGWFRYSTSNPGTGNDSFGTRAPAGGGSALGTGTASVAYSQVVTGLAPATTYFFCAIVSNAGGTSVGAILSFTTSPAPPAVATSAVTGITSTAATLNGQGNPNGDATTCWFRYSTTNPGIGNDTFGTRTPPTGGTAVGAGTAPIAYSRTITGLSPGATYYFCAIGQNSLGSSFGSVLSFTTSTEPSATTSAATSITGTTALLNGQANPNGTAATGWFRYSTTNPGTGNDTLGTRAPASGGSTLGSGSVAVAYSRAISGLSPATTYYFWALASNVGGTSVGAILSFTTSPAPPAVTTSAASGITSTAATLNGQGNPNGDATTCWFRYSTTSPGTGNDTFGTRTPPTGGTAVGAGTAPIAYTRTITGLSPGTIYYFCAIGSNSLGTLSGAVMSFTTLP